MHDHMTVAFECRLPLWWRESYRRPSLFTIWHVDPEADGSDDSCGWSYPKLTDKQRDVLGHCAYHEARHPWFLAGKKKRITSAADAETLMRGMIVHIAKCLRIKVSFAEASEWACDLTHNTVDNFQGALCHVPGWHTNFDEDLVSEREERAKGIFCNVAKIILRKRRPWYRHPRWHVRHWEIQVPVLQNFKRWAFSKCCKCGKGFSWGYSPISGNWHGTGPLWFKSEAGVYHSNCSNPKFNGVYSNEPAANPTEASGDSPIYP